MASEGDETSPDGSPPANIQALAFSLNQNHALCLPVVCVNHKLAWVHSCSIAQEVAHAADALHGAFGAFPYPTFKEMAALARRCSLPVDRVRVWFMVQRLRYGVSWDRADIHKVRKRLLGSPRTGGDEGGGRRTGGGRREREQRGLGLTFVCEDEKSARRRHGKGRGERGSGEAGIRREVGGEEEVEEEQEQGQEGRLETVETPRPPRKRKRGEKKEKGKTSKKRKMEEKRKVAHADETSAGDKGDDGARVRKESRPPEERKTMTKTESQTDLMRQAFRACQFPDKREYDRLSERTGLDRHDLVQWFCDMRYHVKKKGQMRWLRPGEQRRIMSQIRQRQRMKALATIEATADPGAATWRMKLEGRSPAAARFH